MVVMPTIFVNIFNATYRHRSHFTDYQQSIGIESSVMSFLNSEIFIVCILWKCNIFLHSFDNIEIEKNKRFSQLETGSVKREMYGKLNQNWNLSPAMPFIIPGKLSRITGSLVDW
jgi:hypothetical protein